MNIKRCPLCKSDSINYQPWIGQMWVCQNCGYRGPIIIEGAQNADK